MKDWDKMKIDFEMKDTPVKDGPFAAEGTVSMPEAAYDFRTVVEYREKGTTTDVAWAAIELACDKKTNVTAPDGRRLSIVLIQKKNTFAGKGSEQVYLQEMARRLIDRCLFELKVG